MSALDALFTPSSVAVVGDSPTGGRGATMREHLVRLGFPGRLHPVNPKYETIDGRRCYPSLQAIGEPVDAVLIALSAKRAVSTLRDAATIGARAAVVIASGFAETDASGRELQAELAAIAADAGMAVCGPNCYGVMDFSTRFAGYGGPVPRSLEAGNVAMLLQSGALTHAVLNPSSPRGLGLSHLVTTGNEAVVRLGAYVRRAVDDPATKIIACFVEGLRDPDEFADAVVRAREAGKPVVVCKTGRSEGSRRAAVAHTGALAGNDAAFDALCEAAGIIRVDDLDQMVETCLLLSTGRAVESPVVFASISGGGSGVMADLAAAEGLELAAFSESTTARLREVLPAFANVGNPLDLTGAVGEHPELTTETVRVLDAAAEVGTIAFALNASNADNDVEIDMYAGMLANAAAGATDTPLIGLTMTSGGMAEPVAEVARVADVPLLMGMRETIAALARVVRARGRRRDWQPPDTPPTAAGTRTVLSESESSAMVARAGLALPDQWLVDTVDEAVAAAEQIGYPVVIKAESPAIPHKTEAGCVAIGPADADETRAAATRVLAAAHRTAPGAPVRLLVCELIPDGVDLLIGGVAEPGVGHLVVVGLGGVHAELFTLTPQRILAPVTDVEATELLRRGTVGKLLAGYRGAPESDLAAAAAAVSTVSRFLTSNPDVHELDVNPLRVLPKGQGVRVLDALVVLGTDKSS